MMSPESKLFCRLDSSTGSDREQQRLLVLAELGLLEAESIPVFEEATQMAARFLDAPICILGLIDHDRQWFKAAVGLSRVGLMNDLAASRQLPRHESFCTHVVDSHQILAVDDAAVHPAFADGLLVQRYGIRAYLGVPLLTTTGYCLGTLAVMDLEPRNFTIREIEFLELTARWSMSEFERSYAIKTQSITLLRKQTSESLTSVDDRSKFAQPQRSQLNPISSVKVALISQLTQELRTPLTSIMGMASVLNREIYGPLTHKQKEYMDIVHNSGQYLLSLVNEILELGALNDSSQALNLAPVDVEMLCQQAINTLGQAAQRREQQIRLSVEPGRRIWLLDKDKVRQLLYHLVFSVIQCSSAGSDIRIHVSRRSTGLNIAIWVTHLWLGDGLYQTTRVTNPSSPTANTSFETSCYNDYLDTGFEGEELSENIHLSGSAMETLDSAEQLHSKDSRESLGLLLSRRLAEMHGGQISIQGSAEAGYRYVVSLPQMAGATES